MANTAGTLYRTTAFAQSQQRIVSSPTTQWADVFARRERRAIPITIPEPRPLTVRLSIDGEPIEFTYTTSNGSLPPWAAPVLQSLSERWGARLGWDSYQAKPTSPTLVVKLLNILSYLLQDDSRSPKSRRWRMAALKRNGTATIKTWRSWSRRMRRPATTTSTRLPERRKRPALAATMLTSGT